MKTVQSVSYRTIKSPDFLSGERPLCLSNKTTIILVVGFVRAENNFDRCSFARNRNPTPLYACFKQSKCY